MEQIRLKRNYEYSEAEIITKIKAYNPTISDAHIKWTLFDMLKNDQITRIGHRKYISGKGKRYHYNYASDAAKKIDSLVSKAFPSIKVVIWESVQLNEWANLLISKNTIVVEIETGFESIIFDEIMNQLGGKYTILFNPNNEMISRYLRDNLIIVKKLFSRSPVNRKNRKITLEKLIVDILADDYIGGLLGSNSVIQTIKDIKNNYSINKSKVITYAKRRNKERVLKEIWGDGDD